MTKFIKQDCGVYIQGSLLEGPTITILGGVHGNEICGIEVLDFLRKNLKIKKGKIILIYGNIDAITQGKRQGQQNLNRMFEKEDKITKIEKRSYEYKRAQKIKLYLEQSDVSLDLHSSPTTGSPVFIISERNADNIIQQFPFKKVCSGFDSIEPGGTDYFMNSIGKIGICVECGNHNEDGAFENALISTREFLEYFGMLDEDNFKRINKELNNSLNREFKEKMYFEAVEAYITNSNNFRVCKNFQDFEKITEGQLIGYDESEKVYARNAGRILFARDRNKPLLEGFIEIIELNK